MTLPSRNWSTTRAPASVRPGISYWNELLAQHVMPLDVTSPAAARDFSADMEQAQMGACSALMLEARQPQHVDHRLRRARAESDRDTLMLIHMRAGVIDLRSDAGDVRLRRHDAVLLADSDRFVFNASPDTRTLVLRIQRAWLKRWMPRLGDCVGRMIDGSQGWGRTASSALLNIEPCEIPDWRYPAADVADQLAGMLALALQPQTAPVSGGQRALLDQALHLLRQRFAEIELRPVDIAADLGISLRYLHQLFARTGHSFSRTLYGQRLDHAARLLTRKDCGELSITDVALASGFSDSGHFARMFRARYGRCPTLHRKGVIQDPNRAD